SETKQPVAGTIPTTGWINAFLIPVLNTGVSPISVGIEEKGKFVVSFSRLPNGKPNTIVRVSVIDDNAIYSNEGNIKLPQKSSSASENIVSEKVKVEHDMVLAQLIYSKQDQGISIGNWDLYDDPSRLVEKTSMYSAVYFVRCSFFEKGI
ncbi:hypothetical protein, partial [Viridibacillus arvi]|uniref:hypothetical protein n=1 Tax=Viridibacillus arvi TaxID=263475 RepID=UPI003D073AA6